MNLSIVIPSYNEAKNIGNVARMLHAALKQIESSFEIIIVNNGSTDDTPRVIAELSKELTHVVSRHIFPNRGYGNGILTGLSVAKGNVLGWMHSDDQVHTEDVVHIYQKLMSENLEFCKGSRMVRKEHPFRIIRSKIYNHLFQLLFGAPCSDINGSPKLFKRSLYEKIKLESLDWFLDPEIVIKTTRRGCSIGEVPILWERRNNGKSHVKIGTAVEFLKNMLVYRFFKRL